MINKELNLEVYEDGMVWSMDSVWEHPKGGTCTRSGKQLRFSDNGTGYKIANISTRRLGPDSSGEKDSKNKMKSITQHRLVYATFNNLEYNGDYTVGHFNDNPGDNRLDNLYGIFGSKQREENLLHKENAYKVYEWYKRGLFELPDGCVLRSIEEKLRVKEELKEERASSKVGMVEQDRHSTVDAVVVNIGISSPLDSFDDVKRRNGR